MADAVPLTATFAPKAGLLFAGEVIFTLARTLVCVVDIDVSDPGVQVPGG
ncbi:MAG: hypothetical protein AB7J32_25175 [Pseudonocardia sp.]|jgi:hypothetical protein